MIKVFFDLNTKIFYFTSNFTWNKRKTYICIQVYICCAFTWPKIHICIKYIYAKANIRLVWAGVYLHRGVYLHMCKLTFTYMQLRSHAQKYTRVQIIHICIIYIRATDKARKSVITHWKSWKTHWKTEQGVKIRIRISPYALGAHNSV